MIKVAFNNLFFFITFITFMAFPLLGNEVIQPPTNLPDKVLLKTKTESFTHRLYFALRNGRIWMKPNYETTKIKSEWELVPIMGLPGASKKMKPYKQVKSVVEIHSDGNNLIALDQDKTIYYTKIYPLKVKPLFPFSPFWKRVILSVISPEEMGGCFLHFSAGNVGISSLSRNLFFSLL